MSWDVWRSLAMFGAPGAAASPQRRRAVCGAARRSGLGLLLRAEYGDLGLEVVSGLVRPVDGREPEVGDLVELAERPADRDAYLLGGHLGVPLVAQRLLDPLAQTRQVVLGDGPALAGLAYAGDRLVAG